MIPAHSNGAASSSEKAAGSTYAYASGTTACSANPPSASQPVKRGAMQRFLGAVRAKTAHPAGMPQPCDPDPLAEPEASRALAKLVHEPHHLMTGDDSKCPRCQFALGQVEIRPTDATSTDPYPDLSGPRNRG